MFACYLKYISILIHFINITVANVHQNLTTSC